ncbi:MAG: hypothetical protein LBT52_04825 [Clostridiales Family XIII bacterium]|jgi:hypothetical protein|nr:hypothetical protein [Clostridiales Family XIII bacterium]
MTNLFTFDGVASLIKIIRDSGYEFANYHNCDAFDRPCVLRHDIDVSIKSALRFALHEAELHVNSTYFVLLRNDFYNALSPSSRSMLREIMELGNTIGLHYDETVYPEGNHVSNILREASLLSEATGSTIDTVSMHIPSAETLTQDYKIDGMINSYSAKFFKEYKYISDSMMRWREEPVSTIAHGEHEKLHVLTHPIWYDEDAGSMRDRLLSFFRQSVEERYDLLSPIVGDIHNIIDKNDLLRPVSFPPPIERNGSIGIIRTQLQELRKLPD